MCSGVARGWGGERAVRPGQRVFFFFGLGNFFFLLCCLATFLFWGGAVKQTQASLRIAEVCVFDADVIICNCKQRFYFFGFINSRAMQV